MSRIKKYLEIDVLTAARRRIRHVFDTFDTVAVNYSGGKDSQAALWLAREVIEERGIAKLDVVFRDEELIPDAVIDHMLKVRELPWVRMHYFAVPLKSTKFILGKTYRYTQWDTDREWVRPKPDFAITLPEGDARSFDQYNVDGFVAKRFKGKVAFITGIRADESLMRLRSVLNKLNECYVTNVDSAAANVRLAKVIYDWTENDVFKYLAETGFPHCPWYSGQFWSQSPLRVSTPIHAEQAKRLGNLRAIDPEFYGRVLKVFPEVEVQDRYWAELDRDAIRARYGDSPEGIRSYIDEYVTEEDQHAKAMKRLEQALVFHKESPQNYPLKHILNHYISGGFKRSVLPIKT